VTKFARIIVMPSVAGAFVLSAGLLFTGPLVIGETAPDQISAFAAPGGNGNGNGNGAENGNGGSAGRGSQGNGPQSNNGINGSNGLAKGKATANGQSIGSSNSNKDLAEAARDARQAVHESIKGLAEVLGGRLNALHSAINGNTTNAASHSAAGQASVAYGAATSEEGTTEENSETLGVALGNLSTKKEPVEDTSPLEEAIASFTEALASPFQDDAAAEDDTMDDDTPAFDSNKAAADSVNDTIESKDGKVGMSAAKGEESNGEDDL
jgi:hypothetical protein